MTKYRAEIDGLRAIAIASVVLFHAGFNAFPGGYVGVDIFFVISGFLITSIIDAEMRDGRFTFRNFYIRRARRILPALLFFLLVLTPVSYYLLMPEDLIEYGKTLIYTVLFGANFRLAGATNYFQAWSASNPLLHMWSLAVEEQFYFLWPALLLFVWARASSRRVLVTLALAVASLIASQILLQLWPKSAFYHLPARGWELLAGALVAVGAFPPIRRAALAEVLSWLGLSLMIAPVLLYTKETPFPGFAALPPVLGCALVIHAETHVKTRVGGLLSLKPLVFIGLISYSLYLWHWPFLSMPESVLLRDLATADRLLLIICAASMATFSWRFVERPFRRAQGAAATPGASESLLLAVPRRGLGAALAAAAILIFCGSTFQTSKGAPWRLAGLLPEGTEERNKPWQCQKHALNFMECHGSATAKANPDERVVIWGDSHTPPYLGPLSQISPAFTAFYYPGCVPVLNATWVESSGRILFPTCDASKSEMIEKIRALKPTLIVVAARWGNFAGSPYGQEKRAYAFFVRDRKDPLTVERSLEVLEAGLRETLKALSSTGAPILIAAQVPEMTRHIPDCDVASRRFGFDATSCEKMPRSAVEARQMRINPILKKVAAEFPNVSIFWPAEVLCDQAYCYAKRNGQILYADGDHLSDEGGMLLKDALSAAMQKAVGAPKSVEIATHGDVTRSQ